MVQIVGALPEGSTFSDIYNEDLGKDLVGMARTMGQGASFGSADELEAYLRSIIGDKSYSENLNVIRESLKKFDEENPEKSTALFLAGVAPTLGLSAPRLLQGIGYLKSAGVGALAGFTEGFLSGEGTRDRIEEGATGAIIGGVAGPAIFGASQIAPKVIDFAKKLKNKGSVKTSDDIYTETKNKYKDLNPKQLQTQFFLDFIKQVRKEDRVLNDNEKRFVNSLAQKLDYDYLYKNYDLPLDKGSRMQRAIELGFDVDDIYYRGRFSKFDPEELGSTLGEEVYMSKSPFIASTYADFPTSGEIAELVTSKRLGQQEITIDAKGQNFNQLKVDDMTVSIDGGAEKPFKETFPELVKGKIDNELSTDGISYYLRRVGEKDGKPRILNFKNIIDRGAKGGVYDLQDNINQSLGIPKSSGPIRDDDIVFSDIDKPQDERVLIQNPQSARYTRAIFDPLLKDINNLRFGIPLGVLPFVDDGKTPE
jgi:hypothetical protein